MKKQKWFDRFLFWMACKLVRLTSDLEEVGTWIARALREEGKEEEAEQMESWLTSRLEQCQLTDDAKEKVGSPEPRSERSQPVEPQ